MSLRIRSFPARLARVVGCIAVTAALVSSSPVGSGDSKRAPAKPAAKKSVITRAAPTATPDRGSLSRAVWNAMYPNAGNRVPVLEETVQSILQLGPMVGPAVLDVLLGRAAPPTELAMHRVKRSPETDAATFLERQDQVLFAALAALPPANALTPIMGYAAEASTTGGELIVLRALGGIHDPRAIDAWLQIALRAHQLLGDSIDARRAAGDALGSILRNVPEGYVRLRERVETLDSDVTATVAQALSQRDDVEALSVLVRILGRSGPLDGEVVRVIAATATKVRAPCLESDLVRVRLYLAATDDRMRADACSALGALGDANAAPRLVELLADGESIVRSAAAGALERLAKSRVGEDAAAWKAWLEREVDWHSERWIELRAAFAGADQSRIIDALRESAGHPLYRHEVGAAISNLCDDLRPNVAKAACSTASSLDSLAPAKHLINALESSSDETRTAAWTALKKISGRVLPPTSSIWRTTLDVR